MAVWEYRPPLDRVVQHLKFGGLAFLAHDLGEVVALQFARELQAVDLLVPVPLHWRRLLRRGYNQADEMARAIGSLVNRPVRTAVRRIHATRPQSSLPRPERSSNTLGAFRPRRNQGIRGLHIGLIDDVLTTGATLEGCAVQLRSAGAISVSAFVAARTPPHLLDGRQAGRDLEHDRKQLSAEPMDA
jgi:ComF family protein